MFVEEVVMSYVEMHSELFDDEDIEKWVWRKKM
jgi:hypothetical protein